MRGQESQDPKTHHQAASLKPSVLEESALDPNDVKKFEQMLQQGLLRVASSHDTAVQGNKALTAHTSVKLDGVS